MIINEIFATGGTTIFEVMSRLAQEHGAVNLGQGFPEGLEPDFLVAAAARHMAAGPHQYPPMMGMPELRQAVAVHDARFYGLALDWRSQVMITSGATEALADCLLALIRPGDGVILLEPAYDSYRPILRRAGGQPFPIRLQPPDWRLPRAELERAFAAGCRLLILNSPMNPTGKLFAEEELAFIADLLRRHDGVAICDEVYEHLVYDGRRHQPLIGLPGMAGRCLRIGSAGKSFSVTGWKVGYVVAAAELLAPVARAHQFITFTTPPSLQLAVAEGLAAGDDYYANLMADLAAKRDFLATALAAAGLPCLPCAGSYFLTADIRGWGAENDVAFCRRLATEAGVAAIPLSAFYQDGPRHFARFCFAKRDDMLAEAARRLAAAAPLDARVRDALDNAPQRRV